MRESKVTELYHNCEDSARGISDNVRRPRCLGENLPGCDLTLGFVGSGASKGTVAGMGTNGNDGL